MERDFDYKLVHLDVYKDKSVLFEGGMASEFIEGTQSVEAKRRYEKIRTAFDEGFLSSV